MVHVPRDQGRGSSLSRPLSQPASSQADESSASIMGSLLAQHIAILDIIAKSQIESPNEFMFLNCQESVRRSGYLATKHGREAVLKLTGTVRDVGGAVELEYRNYINRVLARTRQPQTQTQTQTHAHAGAPASTPTDP